jgi:hypothetical protein
VRDGGDEEEARCRKRGERTRKQFYLRGIEYNESQTRCYSLRKEQSTGVLLNRLHVMLLTASSSASCGEGRRKKDFVIKNFVYRKNINRRLSADNRSVRQVGNLLSRRCLIRRWAEMRKGTANKGFAKLICSESDKLQWYASVELIQVSVLHIWIRGRGGR